MRNRNELIMGVIKCPRPICNGTLYPDYDDKNPLIPSVLKCYLCARSFDKDLKEIEGGK